MMYRRGSLVLSNGAIFAIGFITLFLVLCIYKVLRKCVKKCRDEEKNDDPKSRATVIAKGAVLSTRGTTQNGTQTKVFKSTKKMIATQKWERFQGLTEMEMDKSRVKTKSPRR